ncbi:helix-turn-helix domain-containing protein [Aquirufa sp. ROCK2-A2]
MNDNQYNNWVEMSDYSLAKTIGAFVKHHRLFQNKTQEDVSAAANISRSTLSLLEKGESITVPTLIQVLRVLDLLYVMKIFAIQEEISPLLLAKQALKKRKRSRGSSKENDNPSSW